MAFGTGVFVRRTHNTIDWVKDTSAEPWRAETIGDITYRGASLNARFPAPFDYCDSITVDYSYLEPAQKNQFAFSKYAFDYPRHKAVGMLRFSLGQWSFDWAGNTRFAPSSSR